MDDKFSRQSFLGVNSQGIIEGAVVGVVGLGGGGSHIVQQLAHLGFLSYVVVDPDVVEDHNLNRLIGGIAANLGEKKVDVAKRIVTGVRPAATVSLFDRRWQECANALRQCDVIFGALDGFRERRELEAFTRRFLIPLVDIGMDVAIVDPEPPQVSGQVILSMPGFACMTCLGFLSKEKLAWEAAKYGDAGIRPQVVWANGVLASTAVGIVVDLLTDWSRSLRSPPYLSYRANTFGIIPHARLPYISMRECTHYPLTEIGPTRFQTL